MWLYNRREKEKNENKKLINQTPVHQSNQTPTQTPSKFP